MAQKTIDAKDAPRNGDPQYAQFDIKHYTHWTLRTGDKQRHLGQALIWLERDGDMQRLSSLTEAERSELWNVVLPEYEAAVQSLWQPDHMNYTWLGNDFHLHSGHGHLHLIPRYKTPRNFAGREFIDDRWGQNYVPSTQKPAPIAVVHAVRDALISQMLITDITDP
jgi:diadenosine tetraphosphate (Ap4A) HIT family hydrolase